jgi:hypothetical protein
MRRYTAGRRHIDGVRNARLVKKPMEELRGYKLVTRRVRRVEAEIVLHQAHRLVLVTLPGDRAKVSLQGRLGYCRNGAASQE